MFGDNFAKSTCLWLKGVKPLIPEITEQPELEWFEWIDSKTGKKKRQPKWFADAWHLKPEERAKIRSKTFPGIAKAMAEQFGSYIMDGKNDMNQEKQITLWDWSPEDCPNQDTVDCGPEFDLSKHMNPPE